MIGKLVLMAGDQIPFPFASLESVDEMLRERALAMSAPGLDRSSITKPIFDDRSNPPVQAGLNGFHPPWYRAMEVSQGTGFAIDIVVDERNFPAQERVYQEHLQVALAEAPVRMHEDQSLIRVGISPCPLTFRQEFLDPIGPDTDEARSRWRRDSRPKMTNGSAILVRAMRR
jgi:hypothetical protein